MSMVGSSCTVTPAAARKLSSPLFVDCYDGLPEPLQQSLEDHWPAIDSYLQLRRPCRDCGRIILDTSTSFHCIEHRAADSKRQRAFITRRWHAKRRRQGADFTELKRLNQNYSGGKPIKIIDATEVPTDYTPSATELPEDIVSRHQSSMATIIAEVREDDARSASKPWVRREPKVKPWEHPGPGGLGGPAPLSAEQLAKVTEARSLMDGGMSENKASLAVGVSRSTLQNWFKKYEAEANRPSVADIATAEAAGR
jgi:hypothetical protein